MVIFVVEVEDFDLGLIDPERDPPVLRGRTGSRCLCDRPSSGAPSNWALISIHLPAPCLQEGNHPAELRHDCRLQSARVIILNETAQPLWATFLIFMDYANRWQRNVSSYTLRILRSR